MNTRRLIIILFSFLIFIIIGFAVFLSLNDKYRFMAEPAPPPPPTEEVEQPTAVKITLTSDEKQTIDIFRKAAASVCSIKNVALARDLFSLEVFKFPHGQGSGFVWNKGGNIITNFHVIFETTKIEVVLSNKKSYPAKVIGVSPDHDIAVLKINAPEDELFPIEVGSSSDLMAGQKVLAIGNPFGLDHTLTTGIVSALGRSIRAPSGRMIYDMIQTDAAINLGNSGGPILDSSGRTIGVASAIFSPSGAYAGVGFAIPIDIVKRVVPQLILFGKVKKVGIGIILVPDHIRSALKAKGAAVMEVIKNSPAFKAGMKGAKTNSKGMLQLGDVIVSIDGGTVKNNDDLLYYMDKHGAPGNNVTIKTKRGKETHTFSIELKSL